MGSSEIRQSPTFLWKDEGLVHSSEYYPVFKKNGRLYRMQKVGLEDITVSSIKQLQKTKDSF